MSSERRRLPQGALIHIANLPPGTTAESLSDVFAANNLIVPVECIDIRPRTHVLDMAVVSVPVQAVARIVHNELARIGCRVTPLEKQPQRDGAAWPPPGVERVRGS